MSRNGVLQAAASAEISTVIVPQERAGLLDMADALCRLTEG
jgi:hypothetical protein